MSLIRLAMAPDLPAIGAIFNHYVLTSTCTYRLEAESLDERQRWFEAHGPEHPVTVCEREGQVVGWASLSAFRPWPGYRFTVENSVYVRQDCHGQGIGRALLSDLIVRAAELGHHSIIAGISADQEASVGLHRALGFAPVALLQEVGYKFDRWLDVVLMQRRLGGLPPT